MITPLQIYLISLADSIGTLLGTCICILIASSALLIIVAVIYFNENKSSIMSDGNAYKDKKDYYNNLKRYRNLSSILFIIFVLTATFAPDTKTLIAMYAIPPIVNNQDVQKLPANLIKFANSYLERNED